MPKQLLYLMVALCIISIYSCNNKKEANSNVATSVQAKLVDSSAIISSDYCSNAFIENNTQTFLVPYQKLSEIKAKKGLKVSVDPAVLQKEDGSAVDCAIQVHIVELTNS